MNPDLMPATAVPDHRPPSRMPMLLAILLGLLLVIALPYTVEQVQYGLTRGAMRARADVAAEQLRELGAHAELVKISDTSRAFRLVAQRLEPSVVHIQVEQLTDSGGRPVFDEWGFNRPQDGFAYRRQGQGSGVVVDPAGHILTNYHVIQGATNISVRFADGRIDNNAQILGYDVLIDLAVLKVNTPGLIAAEWGDSDALEVGDWVLAIGNPFGLDRTVTSGIVSAKQRRGMGVGTPYQDFLQTDAAVNPGNSGGPLVNIVGQLVGINTAIVGQSYRGISFAIPSVLAREVYEQLVTSGEVARGWLGVGLRDVTPEVAARLNLSEPVGALVVGIHADSPARAAGMRPGDVIVEWDGQPVTESTELTLMVARTPIGQRVACGIVRDGQRRDLEVTVARRPEERLLRQ